ncbi:MAG: DUF6279 family lipoprotein [Gammaproteobacteria bacterium]
MTAESRTLLRLAIIALLAVLISACSRADFAYRNADWLLEYYAWRSVRINEAQRDYWQPLMQATLQRHREEELPLVIAWLDLSGRFIRETDAAPGAGCLVDGALLLAERHARLAVELSAPLLADLDATQISHLAGYTTQRQQDAVKRYLDPDPEKRKVLRQQRFLDRIEHWTGKLNDSQRKQVRDAVARIPDLSASWLAHRARQTDTLLAMLGTGASAADLQKYLDEWWVQREGTSAETLRQWRIARDEFVQLMDELATTLTRRQRARIEDRIEELRADLAAFLPEQQLPTDLQAVPACAGAAI